MEPFIVSINDRGQAEYRSFWSGPLGTAVLVVPGVVIALLGIVLGLAQRASGPSAFFVLVIVFCGLYASYAGWDHRRKAMQGAPTAPLAFAFEPDGAAFPRGKRFGWGEVRFVLTAEARPRILCTPVGLAYAVDSLDRTPAEIDDALIALSSGQKRLEQEECPDIG